MPNDDATQTTPMSLAAAHDALADLARMFHNDMNRQGIKELSAKEWLEEFRSWLPSGQTFAEDYKRTLARLEELERRAAR